MKFFNRDEEIKEIMSVIESEPNFIYFIYGPINSGKTALIKEIIENRLDRNKYVVFYFDLREMFISKYDDIIEVLFEEYNGNKKPVEVIMSLIKDIPMVEGIPIPKNTLEELLNKKTSKNVFRYITNILRGLKAKGKQPIIIIDELQKIGDMKINGYFIYELFNYFVSLTKHNHLCHVFCLSSDSLFIEKVYNEATLDDRADYIFVDDFDKEKALEFMDFLAKEILNKRLTEDEKELIYRYVGGKPVLIVKVIEKLKNKDLKKILNLLLINEIQKLRYTLEDIQEQNGEAYNDVINALKLFKDNYEIKDFQIPKKIRIMLVRKNILFLNPTIGIIKPQSYLIWNAIKEIFKDE